jgi:PAS domain S-box-containing protein
MPERVRVLLVEDDPDDVELARRSLASSRRARFEVASAGRLAEALRVLEAGEFDAVLLDLTLPDARDLEGVKRLCGGHPDLPVVVFTGREDEGAGLALLKAGAQDYLLKGAAGPELVRSLLHAIERRKAESAARRVRAQYRRLFEDAADALIIFNPETGRIHDANDAALTLYGYPRREFLALKAVELSAEPEKTAAGFQAVKELGKVKIPLRRHKRRDGSTFAAEISTSVHETEGERLFVAAVRDITDRVSAQAELAESERRFRQIAASITQVFWMTDVEKNVMVYISPAYEAIWGRTCESLYREPMTWMEAIVPEDRDRVREAAMTKQLSGRYDETYRIRRPDGAIRWIRDRAFPVTDNGRVVRVTGVAEDVTRQKETEDALREAEERLRQSQKMEAVGRLAGGVAHDFNNLLTAILGLCELSIATLPEGDPVRLDLEEIRMTARRAATLTLQLLAFSRRQIIAPRPIDLNDVVLGLAKMLRRLIGEHIELAISPARAPAVTRADPGQIEQVIVNLAVNARDAMPSGGKLTIEAGVVELPGERQASAYGAGVRPGSYAVITVADTGAGISDEVRPHLFEPFFTTKPQGEGTGLGLATCYGIAKQNRGFILCRSEPGKGASFELLLPRIAPDAAAAAQAGARKPIPRGAETILVVEDEAAIRRLAGRALRAQGYSPVEAADGQEGLARLEEDREGRIRLALVDMVMPRMGGAELAKAIQAARPDVRILYTSGYTEHTMPGYGAFESGPNFLRKPFTPQELCEKIRETLDSKPA